MTVKMKRRNTHEEVSLPLVVLRPGYNVGTLPGERRCRTLHQKVSGMEGFENLVSMLDYVLDTKRKRHITGGILLSAALLFGGLAMTVMSIKDEEVSDDEQDD